MGDSFQLRPCTAAATQRWHCARCWRRGRVLRRGGAHASAGAAAAAPLPLKRQAQRRRCTHQPAAAANVRAEERQQRLGEPARRGSAFDGMYGELAGIGEPQPDNKDDAPAGGQQQAGSRSERSERRICMKKHLLLSSDDPLGRVTTHHHAPPRASCSERRAQSLRGRSGAPSGRGRSRHQSGARPQSRRRCCFFCCGCSCTFCRRPRRRAHSSGERHYTTASRLSSRCHGGSRRLR